MGLAENVTGEERGWLRWGEAMYRYPAHRAGGDSDGSDRLTDTCITNAPPDMSFRLSEIKCLHTTISTVYDPLHHSLVQLLFECTAQTAV